MVTLTADVTKQIKEIAQLLVRRGVYKSQSEVVRDAIRQLALRYNVELISLKEARSISAKAGSREKISESLRKIRDGN